MQTALYDQSRTVGPYEREQARRHRERMERLSRAPVRLVAPPEPPVAPPVEAPEEKPDGVAIEVTACNGQIVWVRPDEIRAAEAKLRKALGGKISIDKIQRAVCSHFDITTLEMQSARRTAHLVRPRQIAMYLCKVMTLRSLPEIARRFGDRDHTTALHAIRKIDAQVASDPETRSLVESLRQEIKGEES